MHPSWLLLWSGTVSVGFTGTIGNARASTLNSASDAARETRTDKTSAYFGTINATALANGRSEETAQAVRAGIAYDRHLNSRLFLKAFNDWEHDPFQSLDLRFVIGGGAGGHLIEIIPPSARPLPWTPPSPLGKRVQAQAELCDSDRAEPSKVQQSE